MTLADDIRAARQYIVENGWRQGMPEPPGDPDTRVCASVAVWRSLKALMEPGTGHRGTDTIRVLRFAANCEQLSTWNDEYGRTEEQVLALFDRAEAVARA